MFSQHNITCPLEDRTVFKIFYKKCYVNIHGMGFDGNLARMLLAMKSAFDKAFCIFCKLWTFMV